MPPITPTPAAPSSRRVVRMVLSSSSLPSNESESKLRNYMYPHSAVPSQCCTLNRVVEKEKGSLSTLNPLVKRKSGEVETKTISLRASKALALQRPSGSPGRALPDRVITITRLPQCKTSTQLGITIKNCKLSGQGGTSLGDARIGAAIKTVQAGLSGDVAGLRPGMFIVAVDQQTVPLLSQQQIDARKKTSQEQSARLAKALIANAIRTHGKVTLTIRQ
jgi:hypothetical protein